MLTSYRIKLLLFVFHFLLPNKFRLLVVDKTLEMGR